MLRQRFNGKDIIPGDSISKGSFIDLVLGKGLSDEMTAIPLLTGLKLEEARLLATHRFLRIGGILDDNTITTEEERTEAWVYQQRPDTGSRARLPLGSSIDVWITLDSTKIPLPDTMTINADEENDILDM